MGMRIVWGLYDTGADQLVALFEAENLLTQYRDNVLLKAWWNELTVPIPVPDVLPDDAVSALQRDIALDHEKYRYNLLKRGYDFWVNDQVHGNSPRYLTQRYELWNSVPPNVERLVVHFDS